MADSYFKMNGNTMIQRKNGIDSQFFHGPNHNFEFRAENSPIIGTTNSSENNANSDQLAIYSGATKLWGITEQGWVYNPTQIIWTGFLDAISGSKHGGAATATLLSTITTLLNIGNCWNNTNHNFTCPISGIYQIHAHYIKFTGTGAEHLDIYVNGSGFAADRNRIRGTADSYDQASGTYYFNLSAGDYIDFREFGDGMHQGHNEFSIRYVG